MYQITCDKDVLYDLRAKRYVVNPVLSMEVNKSGTLTFTVPCNNPCATKKLNGVFEVFRDGIKIFEGRCLNEDKDFYNSKKIQVLGALDYFNDSIMRPFELHNIGVKDFLTYIINSHNKQVDKFKQFKVGNVDVVDFDGGETIYRKSEEYKKTWEIIQDRLIDRLGGYLSVRFVGDDKYIDFTQKSGKNSTQVIEFGKNLLDITQYSKGDNIKTCIIPIGKDNLNISSVNDGKDYVYDPAAVSMHGWIWDTVKFDDITVAENLLNKARKYLQNCINLALTIELNAVDLSLINKNVDSFICGEYPLIISKQHGLSRNMQISKITISLDNPADGKITLGNTITGLTDKNINAQKKAQKVENIQTNITSLNTAINKNKSDIDNISTNITTINTDIEEYNKKLEQHRIYQILGI